MKQFCKMTPLKIHASYYKRLLLTSTDQKLVINLKSIVVTKWRTLKLLSEPLLCKEDKKILNNELRISDRSGLVGQGLVVSYGLTIFK